MKRSPQGNKKVDSSQQLSIKRKWQTALRRYLTEDNPSISYAPIFGLPASDLRKWIEIQFTDDLSWQNFGVRWNLSQRVPATLFDLTDETDLVLCWNFLNIIVQDVTADSSSSVKMLLSAEEFYNKVRKTFKTGQAEPMLKRLTTLQIISSDEFAPYQTFISANEGQLSNLTDFDAEDFARLNRGEDINDLLMEKEIIKKYGN